MSTSDFIRTELNKVIINDFDKKLAASDPNVKEMINSLGHCKMNLDEHNNKTYGILPYKFDLNTIKLSYYDYKMETSKDEEEDYAQGILVNVDSTASEDESD